MSSIYTPIGAVGAAIRRSGQHIMASTALTPFDIMAAAEELEYTTDEQAIRGEAIAAWLGWIWEGGVDLSRAAKRLVTYTRLYRPDLVHGLTCEEAASLFGQGRAAESARASAVDTALIKGGYRHTTLPGRKSERARAKMAAAQKGNQHRARSVKK